MGPLGPYRRVPRRVLDHVWGVQYPHFMVPQMDAADLRGPFLIGSLVPRPQKVQKRGHFRGVPQRALFGPHLDTPLFGTPWGPWRGVGPYGVPLRPV